MLILGKHAKNVESIDNRQLDIIAFIEDKTSYIYYDDDGKTYDFKKGKYSEIAIEIEKADGEFKINIDNRGNEKVQRLNFEIIDVDGSITKKSVDIN
jgi:alpha-glucosidase